MVEYSVISEDAWQKLPTRETHKPDEWAELMIDLENGHIVSVACADDKDRRGKRIAIARRASRRGFKTDVRYTDSVLAVRRVGAAAPPAPEPPQQRRRRKTGG